MLGRLVRRSGAVGGRTLRSHLIAVTLPRRYYADEPSSRHPLVPPGPDNRFVEPKDLGLPELPPFEEFDETDPKYDAIITTPLPHYQPEKLQDWSQKMDAQKTWRERWRDRWRRNCALQHIPFLVFLSSVRSFDLMCVCVMQSVAGRRILIPNRFVFPSFDMDSYFYYSILYIG
jgi:hypothetical protein